MYIYICICITFSALTLCYTSFFFFLLHSVYTRDCSLVEFHYNMNNYNVLEVDRYNTSLYHEICNKLLVIIVFDSNYMCVYLLSPFFLHPSSLLCALYCTLHPPTLPPSLLLTLPLSLSLSFALSLSPSNTPTFPFSLPFS